MSRGEVGTSDRLRIRQLRTKQTSVGLFDPSPLTAAETRELSSLINRTRYTDEIPNEVGLSAVGAVLNVFCPTGKGGGVKPDCKSGASAGVGGDAKEASRLSTKHQIFGVFKETHPETAKQVVATLEKLADKYGLPSGGVHIVEMKGGDTGHRASMSQGTWVKVSKEDAQRLKAEGQTTRTAPGPDRTLIHQVKDNSVHVLKLYTNGTNDLAGFNQSPDKFTQVREKRAGYSVSSGKGGVEDTVTHEFGHSLTFRSVGEKGVEQLIKEKAPEGAGALSTYARTDRGEATAEAFVKYESGDRSPLVVSLVSPHLPQSTTPPTANLFPGMIRNVFCRTGKGGGIDPTCKKGGAPGPRTKPRPEKKEDVKITQVGSKPERFKTVEEAEKHIVSTGLAQTARLSGLTPAEASGVVAGLEGSLRLGDKNIKLRSIVVKDMDHVDQHHNAHYSTRGDIEISSGFAADARSYDRGKTLAEYAKEGGTRNYTREEAHNSAEAFRILVSHEVGHHVEHVGLLDLPKANRTVAVQESDLLKVSGYSTMNNQERFAEIHALVSTGRGGTLPPKVREWYEAALATADPQPLENFIRNSNTPAATVGITSLPGTILNVFCPTGKGGGIKPDCKGATSSAPAPAPKPVQVVADGVRYTKQEDGRWKSDTGVVATEGVMQRWKDRGSVQEVGSGTGPGPVAKTKHDAVEKDLRAINLPDKRTGLTPVLPKLYDELKKKHPTLTREEFKQILLAMEKAEKVTLQRWGGWGFDYVKESTGYGPGEYWTHPTRGGYIVWVQTRGQGPTSNVFCPTGRGGGIDPTCKPLGIRGGTLLRTAEAKLRRATMEHRLAEMAANKAQRTYDKVASRAATAMGKEYAKIRQINGLKADLAAAKAAARRLGPNATPEGKARRASLERRIERAKGELVTLKAKTREATAAGMTAKRQADVLRKKVDRALVEKQRAEAQRDRVRKVVVKKQEPKPPPPPPPPPVTAGLTPPILPKPGPYVPPPRGPLPPVPKLHPEMDPGRTPITFAAIPVSIPAASISTLYARSNWGHLTNLDRSVMVKELGGEKVLRDMLDSGLVERNGRKYSLTKNGEEALRRAVNGETTPLEFRPPAQRSDVRPIRDAYGKMTDDQRKEMLKYFKINDSPIPDRFDFEQALVQKMRARANNPAELKAKLDNSPHEQRRKEMASPENVAKLEQYKKDYMKLTMDAEQKRASQATLNRAVSAMVKEQQGHPPGSEKYKELAAAIERTRDLAMKRMKEAGEIERQVYASKKPEDVAREHFLNHFGVPNPDTHAMAAHDPKHARTAQEAVEFVNKIMPNDGRPKATVATYEAPGDTRAHYDDHGPNPKINVAPSGEPTHVMVHELGHHVDNSTPGVLAASVTFVKMRAGEEKNKPMTDFSGGYKPHEVGVDDDFAKAFGGDKERGRYAGKDYHGKYTEVVSMGLEQLHRDPVKFAKDDPEYFNFVMGALHGDTRAATP
jgi:hypothetical protein